MKILLGGAIKRRIGEDVTASRSTIIFQLGKHLAQRGHQVTLLGTKDSQIPGVATHGIIEKGFVDLPPFENAFYAELSYLIRLEKEIERLAPEFDIVHNHSYPEFINLFAAERIKTPIVTTLHAQATKEFDEALSLFPSANLVGLSNAHKRLFTKSHMQWVVHNGIDTNIYVPGLKKENYLFWLGRLGRAKDSQGNFVDAKGIKWAIELARKTGEKLIISGNVEDMEFYEKDVKPYLGEKIVWYGPVSSEQKLRREEVINLMQKAKVFLMTINWEEPFGLVMAEAMACGTPVIGFDRGAVSEVVVDGKTGFVVDSQSGIEGLKIAFSKIGSIDLKNCREHIINNFSIDKMVDNYEKVYNELIHKKA